MLLPFVRMIIGFLLVLTLTAAIFDVARVHMIILTFLSAGMFKRNDLSSELKGLPGLSFRFTNMGHLSSDRLQNLMDTTYYTSHFASVHFIISLQVFWSVSPFLSPSITNCAVLDQEKLRIITPHRRPEHNKTKQINPLYEYRLQHSAAFVGSSS